MNTLARPEPPGGGSSGFISNFPNRSAPSSTPSSRPSRDRPIGDSSSWPWPRSSLWAGAPSPTCSASWTPWLPDTPVVITGSSRVTAGRSRPWHAATSRRSSPASRRSGPILLAGDDTVTEHPGPHVYGKGRHRDPVRSTHTYTAFRWGHKWVVLALLVPVPWATRRWALPLLVALYRPRADNLKLGKPHKTPPQLLGQMVRILMRWFPDRTFVVTADGGYATHELAELAAKTPRRLTLVSLFYPDANLVEPPPEYSGKGRPRVKGKDLPSPAEVVAERRAKAGPGGRLVRRGPTPGRDRDRDRALVQEAAVPWWSCVGSSSTT